MTRPTDHELVKVLRQIEYMAGAPHFDAERRGKIGVLAKRTADALDASPAPHPDTERLDWLLDDLAIDEIEGRDVHEIASQIAENACGKGKEPTPAHYHVAYRELIDAARLRDESPDTESAK